MYRQRRVLYPLHHKAAKQAVWKLLRFGVLLAGILVLGAAVASQGASASTVAEPSAGQPADPPSPSEPSGHRPASGTTSLLVKLNATLPADQVKQLVNNDGGSERTIIPALRLVVVDVPSSQLESIRGRYQKDKRVKSVELDNV